MRFINIKIPCKFTKTELRTLFKSLFVYLKKNRKRVE